MFGEKVEYGVKRVWDNGYTEYEPMMFYESAKDRVQFYTDERKDFKSSIVVREVTEWRDAT